MGFKEKIAKEIKALCWISLYFLCWFATLMVIKQLLLHEYRIEFYGASMVVVGTLVAAKAVLILENAPLFKGSKTALSLILKRSFLYLAGVFMIMVLEKSFEARHEYGGFINALKNLGDSANMYHIWANILVVFGALFFYNLWTVMKKHLGKGGLKEILLSPYPDDVIQ